MAFRHAVVRMDEKYADFELDWRTPTQHEIDETGTKWTSMPGLALKYELTYSYQPRSGPRVSGSAFAGIMFGS
jgi:hypothetical protein